MEPKAEDLGDLVGSEAIQSDVAGALKQLVDGKVTAKDQVAAVLDLLDGVLAPQPDGLAFLRRKAGSQLIDPVVEPPLDGGCIQAVGDLLQGLGIVNSQKGVVVLAVADVAADQLPLDEGVAIEIAVDLERQKGADTKRHRSQHRIVDVEVKMGVAASLAAQDTVAGILDWIAGLARAERRPHFHAAQDGVDAETLAPVHTLQIGTYVILLAHALFGPLDGNIVLIRIVVHPATITVSTLSQGILSNRPDAVNVPKEVHDVFLAGQQRQVGQDDHPFETVVYKREQTAKQFVKGFHRSSP